MEVTRFPRRAGGPADRLAGFVAHLRLNGIAAGLPETETAMAALARVDAARIGEVRSALRAVCVSDAEQNGRFDDLFDAYWLNRGRERQRETASNAARNALAESGKNYRLAPGASADAGEADAPDDAPDGGATGAGTGRLVASRIDNIDKTDLRKLMTPQDLERAQRVAEQIARAIRDRRSRRRKAALRGARLDMRRVLRRSVSRGGEPIDLFYRTRPDRPVRLVALLDVSGSMTVYARVFLAFLKGLVSADRRTEAYLFHTRLVRISDALRDGDTLRAVNRLSLMAQADALLVRPAGDPARRAGDVVCFLPLRR